MAIEFVQPENFKCPHCGKVQPGIRRVPAFQTEAGITVIYNCDHCKKILGLETLAEIGSKPKEAA